MLSVSYKCRNVTSSSKGHMSKSTDVLTDYSASTESNFMNVGSLASKNGVL